MALVKSGSAITQLTASGTSTTLDVSTSYGHTLGVRLYNGTSGTPTTASKALVQWKRSSGTNWIDLASPAGDLVATSVLTFTVAIPDAAASVQIVYTQPSGGAVTGFTCDAEVGTITGL